MNFVKHIFAPIMCLRLRSLLRLFCEIGPIIGICISYTRRFAFTGMLRSAVPFKGQKYEKLKKDCLKKGELFKDPEFPANNKSLFYSKFDEEIEWKRPKVSPENILLWKRLIRPTVARSYHCLFFNVIP